MVTHTEKSILGGRIAPSTGKAGWSLPPSRSPCSLYRCPRAMGARGLRILAGVNAVPAREARYYQCHGLARGYLQGKKFTFVELSFFYEKIGRTHSKKERS